MNKPQIYAKSALKIKQIEAKEKIGCDGIELQMLSELVTEEMGKYNDISVYPLKEIAKHNITCLHAPLMPNYGITDLCIEFLVEKQFKEVFYKIVEIAEYFGAVQNKVITIIIHTELSNNVLIRMPSYFNKIVELLGSALKRNSHIRFGIENVTPLRDLNSGSDLSNNFGFTLVDIVKELRNRLNTDRIGIVLDICHAKISEKYMNVIYDAINSNDFDRPDFSLDSYFRKYAEYCFLIHLANFKDSGYGKGNHAQPYTEKTLGELAEVLDLYEKYNYSCPITIEVEETDYEVNTNYATTKRLVDSYYTEREKIGKESTIVMSLVGEMNRQWVIK